MLRICIFAFLKNPLCLLWYEGKAFAYCFVIWVFVSFVKGFRGLIPLGTPCPSCGLPWCWVFKDTLWSPVQTQPSIVALAAVSWGASGSFLGLWLGVTLCVTLPCPTDVSSLCLAELSLQPHGTVLLVWVPEIGQCLWGDRFQSLPNFLVWRITSQCCLFSGFEIRCFVNHPVS